MSNDDSNGVGVMSDSDLSSLVAQDELNHEEDLFSDVFTNSKDSKALDEIMSKTVPVPSVRSDTSEIGKNTMAAQILDRVSKLDKMEDILADISKSISGIET